MRIVFAGTPDFAVPALTALVNSGYDVVAVYTQPDRPSGRGRKLTASPVKCVAEQAGIPVLQPVSFREAESIQQLRNLKPDLMVVVAYGLILPTEVLGIPQIDCINIHASLLPRWRGAAPIQRAIMSGDQQTGVTIMRMETKLDTGPIYLKVPVRIQRQTSDILFRQLANTGAEALISIIPQLHSGAIKPEAQDETLATYAKKISKEEARLDWQLPASVLDCQIRGMNPWPVANTLLEGKTLRIWQSQPVSDTNEKEQQLKPGQIVCNKHQIKVMTGDGMLELTEIQRPGGKRLTATQFLNAHPIDGMQLI